MAVTSCSVISAMKRLGMPCTLAVSTLRRRKKGRDTVQGIPSRFIAEMKLHEVTAKQDPREKLKALRAAAAQRAAQGVVDVG